MLNTYPNSIASAIIASNDKTEMCNLILKGQCNSMEAVHSRIISLTVNYKTKGIAICTVLQCLCIYTKDGSKMVGYTCT